MNDGTQSKKLNTVMLDPTKCKGCVTCMKRCPTEAIRVRDGKASVIYERCIGCGECLRLCPHHAKLAAYDPFDTIMSKKYRIALPAPSLYGQFNNLTDINYVLNGLLKIGFNDVFEVGRAAELVSEVTKVMLSRGEIKAPVISTACPAVLELILLRFHNLMPNLMPTLAPVDVAAKMARERAIKRGIPPEDIGVYFISPCPAKVFALKSGIGVEQPLVDGVLAVSDVYVKLLNAMNNLQPQDIVPISKLGVEGISWARSGGEANALYRDKTLAADGIENVLNILRGLENGSVYDVDFIELNACAGGCVGGVLNIENPFVARARLRALRKRLPDRVNTLADECKSLDYYLWDETPNYHEVFKLADNRMSAMGKLIAIENTLAALPQIDCGLCGAPSCKAFAEDKESGRIPPDTLCPKQEDKK